MNSDQIIEPLLYIDQPILQKPKAHMQEHYQDEMTKAKVEKTTSPSNEVKDLPSQSSNSDDSFKNLTIQEKVNYLIKLPSGVPKIKCEVLTTSKKYRGILIEDHDKEVVLRIFGRENEIVQKDDILNINLLGF